MQKIILIVCFLGLGLLTNASIVQAQSETLPDELALTDSTELFDMAFEDLVNLQVTTASKTAEKAVEAPATLTVIQSTDIEAYGANSLGEVLERITGAYLSSIYQAQNNFLSLRGDAVGEFNNHILILIDGRPTRESMYNGSNVSLYNSFPLESLQRIEIIRGPGSVLYGTCAYMGVINLITRTGEGTKGRANISYGSFGSLRAGANGSFVKNKLEIQASGNYRSSKGWEFPAFDETRYQDTFLRAQNNLALQLKLKYKGIRFQSFICQDEQNSMGQIPVWLSPVDYQIKSSRLWADVGYEKELNRWWKSSLNVTYNGYISTTERNKIGNTLNSRALSNDALAEWTNYFTLHKKITLTVGGVFNFQTGKYTKYDLTSNLQPYDITQVEINPDPLIVIEPYKTSFISQYTQLEYRPSSKFKIIGGLQANKFPQLALDLTPRLAVVGHIFKNIYLKGMFGSAFRSASAIERRSYLIPIYIGNNILNPEKIYTFEAQIAYARGSHNFALTYFYTQQNNLISLAKYNDPTNTVFINQQITPRFHNSASVSNQGVEFEFQNNLKQWVRGLSVLGSLSYYTSYAGFNTPQVIGKLGIAYKSNFGLHAGIFHHIYAQQDNIIIISSDDRFSTKNYNPAVSSSFLYASLNIGYDISVLLFPESAYRESITLDFWINNLYNATVYVPEYQRNLLNSIPGRAPMGIFARLSFKI